MLQRERGKVSQERSIVHPTEFSPYLQKHSELAVSFHILLQSLLRPRQLPHVRGIGQSELDRRIKEDIPDLRNDLTLFSLSNIHRLEQVSIAFTQVKDIAKNLFDEFVRAAFDDRRIRISQRANENLTEARECLIW